MFNVFQILLSLILVASGAAKLLRVKKLHEAFVKMNFTQHITWVAFLEIGIAILYCIPQTTHVGFFFICSYLGGAIVAHLSAKENVAPPVVLLILFWIVTYLLSPSLFGI